MGIKISRFAIPVMLPAAVAAARAEFEVLSVSVTAPDSFNIFSMSIPIAEHEACLSARVPHEVRGRPSVPLRRVV